MYIFFYLCIFEYYFNNFILIIISTCVLVFLLDNIFSMFFPISSMSEQSSSSKLSPSSVDNNSLDESTRFCKSNIR